MLYVLYLSSLVSSYERDLGGLKSCETLTKNFKLKYKRDIPLQVVKGKIIPSFLRVVSWEPDLSLFAMLSPIIWRPDDGGGWSKYI